MWKRMTGLTMVLAIVFSLMYMRVLLLTQDQELMTVGRSQGQYTLQVGREYAHIYDHKGRAFTNAEYKYKAVAAPTPAYAAALMPYVAPSDKEKFESGLTGSTPFIVEVTKEDIPGHPEIKVFKEPIRTSSSLMAPHVIGYTRDNEGVSGLERAYDSFLRDHKTENSVTMSLDGTGKLLLGEGEEVKLAEKMTAGVVSTLDMDIQAICQEAARDLKKGAVVVMTPNGDLRGVVSKPTFDPTRVGDYLTDTDSPLLNRAFSAYSVGSVFKIVTAAEGLEQGFNPKTIFNCKGYTDVSGQIMRCHKLEGHGNLNLGEAMAESCNPYFIQLGLTLSPSSFANRAYALGFGQSTRLCNGISAASGNLQSEDELVNPAELANLSFGQGMLTATPVQVACMTAAVVNQGRRPSVRLTLGTTLDGSTVAIERETAFTYAMSPKTAQTLQRILEEAIYGSTASNALGYDFTAGGKTSTAQTGRFTGEGDSRKEVTEAWFTGFFPADTPKYIVTVLAEDSESGNRSAAPIFKEIAQRISRELKE